MDKHEVISALLAHASELGRTPSRDEFIKLPGMSNHYIAVLFGSYATLVQAAGLDSPSRNRKINNTIFEVNIEKHLEAYKVKPNIIDDYPTIVSISDKHWPFANPIVQKRFEEYTGDMKPKYVILNGDAWDMYSHTKFPRSHNLFTPREEEQKSRQMNEEFWKSTKRVHPDAICYQMMGNHDVRPMKRVMEIYPEAEDWIKERLHKMFSFEGVTTIYDAREELILGNIAIFHGYRSKLGEHRDYILMNTINGHTHVGGVSYRKIRGATLWEMNSGLSGDPEAKVLTYTPQKITHWTPGFGAVDKLGARFIAC